MEAKTGGYAPSVFLILSVMPEVLLPDSLPGGS